MSLSFNLKPNPEFPNEADERIDSKSSQQDKDTSGSAITSDSKTGATPEKNVQQKAPINIPKLKIHSPPAMKIPISPRALKSPKRNPEEKNSRQKKKKILSILKKLKKTLQKNGQIRLYRIVFRVMMIKKLKDQIHRHHKL